MSRDDEHGAGKRLPDAQLKSLADKVRGWRLLHGLTIDQASERSGIDKATWSKIENRKVSAPGPTLLRLRAIIGLSLDDLLGLPPLTSAQLTAAKVAAEVLSSPEETDDEPEPASPVAEVPKRAARGRSRRSAS